MNIRTIISVMMILMGIWIENQGLPVDSRIGEYFGPTIIGLGGVNLILDFFRKKKSE